MKKNILVLFFVSIFLYIQGCGPAKGNRTGREYMPDMSHGIAYEANYYDYYAFNTWGSEEDYHRIAQPRVPVKGTIPFGQAGFVNASADKIEKLEDALVGIPASGSVPFEYENNEDERLRAIEQMTKNPFPITEYNLEHGKEMYMVYCGICHGDKGDGEGYLVREDGGVYPAQPANLVNEELTNSSAGRFYFAIMYGKNVMGGYADKLSYEERWQVIHYIRSLQASAVNLKYTPSENTLNSEAIPEKGKVTFVDLEEVEE